MPEPASQPKVFRVFTGEAGQLKHTAFGTVGSLYSGEGIEAVWVAKKAELIDTEWFSQPTVDLITVIAGRLRVEYEDATRPPDVLTVGDFLVLPPNTRCRAYNWPRESQEGAVFLAIYPVRPEQTGE
jgi:hypothetical protein